MEILSSAYFCTTPYQITASIALHYALKDEADIFIIPSFKDAEKYADNLRRLNIFRRVKVVDKDKIVKKTENKPLLLVHLGIVEQYFRVDEIAKIILYDDTIYKKCYFSSKAFIPRMAYFYYIKHDIDAELYYYDDGEGSYDFRFRTEPSLFDKIARLVLFGKKGFNKAEKIYLYDPELYKEINGQQNNISVLPIPRAFNDLTFKETISKIFDIHAKDLINEKVIIIDMIKEIKYGSGEVDRINQTYMEMQKFFSTDEIIIKRHPRDKSNYCLPIKCYENDSMPFESICTQMDMSKKVLIGLYSTALIIPKILLDQEPTVILLYRLFKRSEQTEQARKKQDQFYEICKSRYKEPNKFFIPESMEELHEALIIASSK